MVLYNKGVEKKHKALYSSVIVTVLIAWLKKQVESVLMSFWYIYWAPSSK